MCTPRRVCQVTVQCPVACVGFFERFGLAVQEANEKQASMRGVLDDALNKCVSLAILASYRILWSHIIQSKHTCSRLALHVCEAPTSAHPVAALHRRADSTLDLLPSVSSSRGGAGIRR